MAVARGLMISSARTLLRLTVPGRMRDYGYAFGRHVPESAAGWRPRRRRPRRSACCVVVVLNLIDSASGSAWTTSNAIAFIVLEAHPRDRHGPGRGRDRPGPAVEPDPGRDDSAVHRSSSASAASRPTGSAGGSPPSLFAVAGLAGLFAPASLRALTHQAEPPVTPRGPPRPFSRRRLAPRAAGPASWPAAGTRASGRCRARRRSATGSCCRRTAAAGSSSPAAAAARAAA